MSWDKTLWVLRVSPSDHLSDQPIRGEACFYKNTYKAPNQRPAAAGLLPLRSGLQLRPQCDSSIHGSGVSCARGSFSRGSFSRGLRVRRVSPGVGCSLLAAAKKLVLWGCCYRENLIIFKLKFVKSECSFSSRLENVTRRPSLPSAYPRLLEGICSTACV